MRAKEFIFENQIVDTIQIGKNPVDVHQHSIDQTRDRHVTPSSVIIVLKQLPKVQAQIDQLQDGQAFYITDPRINVSLGFRKLSNGKLLFATVIPTTTPYARGDAPVFMVNQLEKQNENQETINLGHDSRAQAKSWIEKVYAKYPHTMQNNHVMVWGEGEAQQFAMFELTPSFSKRGAVEVKWFQAYPLRQGVGSRAMSELQSLAREDNIHLTLFPWDKGQVSQTKLTKFYKGHGFKPVSKGSKSMQWGPDAPTGI